MLAHFQRDVQEIAERYPDSRSAVLPALRMAQERHGGWLPVDALREVADVLDLTPAYCHAVECLGGCGYAPVVAVDSRYRHNVTPEDAAAIVEEIRGAA